MTDSINNVPLEEACRHCGAFCCTYYALPLDDPENKRDFDDMRWFLMHPGNYVYVEDGEWFLNIAANCKFLAADGRCEAYEKRPQICREHGNGEDPCEFHADYQYDDLFCEVKDMERYAVEALHLTRSKVKDWFIHDDEEFWKKHGSKG